MNRLPPDSGPAPLSLQHFVDALDGSRFAGRVVILDSVDSTIEECRRLADEGAPAGTVVLSEEQRRGRGQRGRAWHSPRGAALYLSALLRPPLPPHRAGELVHLAGLAVLRALGDEGVEGLVLKAPNDVLVALPSGGPRKIAGVLVDTAVQGEELRHVIVSLGLNVHQGAEDFPEALRPWAASLAMACGRRFSRSALGVAVLRRLELTCEALEAGREAALLEDWGREITACENFSPPVWDAEDTT